MATEKNSILTINGGSSSIKFSVYESGITPVKRLDGSINNIGTEGTNFHFAEVDKPSQKPIPVAAGDQDAAAQFLVNWLKEKQEMLPIKAIAHRVVHGMTHTDPELLTAALIKELGTIAQYDPDHLPAEIKLIEVFGNAYPGSQQIACFDTAFHTSMPPVARRLPLPRKYREQGIERYGFHGLSYAYLLQQLRRTAGDAAANGKVIMAHLGSGASLAAVKEGKSLDTSMGFTPASGIPMSTRTGDLDPGVAWYLMQSEQLSADQFSHLINKASGLLGVSGISADMRVLLERQQEDSRAAEAVELFCYQAKKWIGSFAAVLGGVDTLLFSGGIGERAPEIRSRICAGLAFLGIVLDEDLNKANESIISNADNRVCVRVMKTDEEQMMAELVCGILNKH